MMNKLNRGPAKTTSNVNFECEAGLARLLPPGLRAMVRTEYHEVGQQRRHMFHLAMTEAAALAWQTGFPQLFLPSLALEKAQALAAWSNRQENIRRGGAAFAN
jgi:hypothetical protein